MSRGPRRTAEWRARGSRLLPWLGGAVFLLVLGLAQSVPRRPDPTDFRHRIDAETTLVSRSHPMVSRPVTLNVVEFTLETAPGSFWAGSAFGPYDPTGRPVEIETVRKSHRIEVTLPPGFNVREPEVNAGPWQVAYSVRTTG